MSRLVRPSSKFLRNLRAAFISATTMDAEAVTVLEANAVLRTRMTGWVGATV